LAAIFLSISVKSLERVVCIHCLHFRLPPSCFFSLIDKPLNESLCETEFSLLLFSVLFGFIFLNNIFTIRNFLRLNTQSSLLLSTLTVLFYAHISNCLLNTTHRFMPPAQTCPFVCLKGIKPDLSPDNSLYFFLPPKF
jgi:hypothetical protein